VAKQAKPVWNSRKTVLENAESALPALTKRYLRAGKKLKGQPSDKALHKFRLQTKNFRYTLELFRTCLGSNLDARLEALKRIQQRLGDINDCVTTRKLLFDSKKKPRTQEERQLWKFLDSRIQEKTTSFMRQLKRSLQAAPRQKWWSEYDRDNRS